jgi:hypothetical protein
MKICFTSLKIKCNEMRKTGNGVPAKGLPIYRVYETAEVFIDIFWVRNCCMNSATELMTSSLKS